MVPLAHGVTCGVTVHLDRQTHVVGWLHSAAMRGERTGELAARLVFSGSHWIRSAPGRLRAWSRGRWACPHYLSRARQGHYNNNQYFNDSEIVTVEKPELAKARHLSPRNAPRSEVIRRSSEHDLAAIGQAVVIRSNFCAASRRR
jgi:hypothetical protein